MIVISNTKLLTNNPIYREIGYVGILGILDPTQYHRKGSIGQPIAAFV